MHVTDSLPAQPWRNRYGPDEVVIPGGLSEVVVNGAVVDGVVVVDEVEVEVVEVDVELVPEKLGVEVEELEKAGTAVVVVVVVVLTGTGARRSGSTGACVLTLVNGPGPPWDPLAKATEVTAPPLTTAA